MSDKMKKALHEWCDDHYNEFGYYPLDFEYNDKLYEILLTKDDTFELKEVA
tara:strand:- start:412 stop:564 length:153 start_codon:yes stop_codon:yes gene_type:complete